MQVHSAQHRSGRSRDTAGGRRKSEASRCEPVGVRMLPSDMRDAQVLCEAWGVPMSTLVWSVFHDWLSRERGVSSTLCDARGPLRMALEMALRDAELGSWLRGMVTERPLG